MECGFITSEEDLSIFNANIDTIARGVLACFGIAPTLSTVGWVKDSTGWWFQNADGTYPKNEWLRVYWDWYYFDGDGYAVRNRIQRKERKVLL